MKVVRTEQIWIPPNKQLSHLCHISKNLYNRAIYVIKKEHRCRFPSNGIEYIRKEGEFSELPAQTAQQILRRVRSLWFAFLKSFKQWERDQTKPKPRPPKYKRPNGEFVLYFTNQQCKIRNGVLMFPRKIGFTVKTRLADDVDLREVRIVPKGVGYVVEIAYRKEVPDCKSTPNRVVGIDLGLRNFITLASNIGKKPIVLKGGVLKSINQFYNKEKTRLQSIYAKQGVKESKRLKRLTIKHNFKINDFMHKASRFVIKWCLKQHIDTIVIGQNKGWKQRINLGKINNQEFVSIPFGRFIHQVQYKAEEVGIRVIIINEAHTSKCSFIDNEPIEHHEHYVGKRISRGLFRSSKGQIINADVNGALNLIRKAIPNAFVGTSADGIEGVGLHPEVIGLSPQRVGVLTNS